MNDEGRESLCTLFSLMEASQWPSQTMIPLCAPEKVANWASKAGKIAYTPFLKLHFYKNNENIVIYKNKDIIHIDANRHFFAKIRAQAFDECLTVGDSALWFW